MLNYEIVNETVIITGATADEEIVSIPSTLIGYPVVEIKDEAFLKNEHIKSVTIPGSVLVIGEYAFASCKSLSRVVIAEGLKEIKDYAFISAPLESLDLPSSLKELGEHAFYGTGFRAYAKGIITKNEINQRAMDRLNNKCCIFPSEYENKLNLINGGLISIKSKYNNEQFKKYINAELTSAKLDLPLVFNNDEVLIALSSKIECDNLHIEISKMSEEQLKLKGKDDEDFILITCDVCNGDEALSSLAIKVPYLDSIRFKILKIASKKTRDNIYYCMLVRIEMDNFKNLNTNRIYSLNMFDELLEKYETSKKNNLLSIESFNRLEERINTERLKPIAGFIAEVKGSPLLSYTIKLFKGALYDSDLKNQRMIDFTYDRLKKYYYDLNNADSLTKIAFDVDDALGIIMEDCGYNIDDLNKRYGIGLTDEDGNTLTIKKARAYRRSFNENMENYKIYAKYYNMALDLMKKINNEYVMLKYFKE